MVQSQDNEDEKGLGEELAVMPRRKSVSEAAMWLAVAVAFPRTIRMLGT